MKHLAFMKPTSLNTSRILVKRKEKKITEKKIIPHLKFPFGIYKIYRKYSSENKHVQKI
jgi:hypothetical protein